MSVSKQLSSDDLLRAVPGAVFMRYPNLKHFSSVDAVLSQSPIQVVFVLYLTEGYNSGHWCTLLRRQNGEIEWFDPYGLKVDEEARFIKASERKKLDETTPVMLQLLLKSKEKWIWNSFDLQSHSPVDQTCGRWAILRALHRDLNDKQFYDFMQKEATRDHSDLDKAAVRLTEPLIRST